jgi:hypothetical protein
MGNKERFCACYSVNIRFGEKYVFSHLYLVGKELFGKGKVFSSDLYLLAGNNIGYFDAYTHLRLDTFANKTFI